MVWLLGIPSAFGEAKVCDANNSPTDNRFAFLLTCNIQNHTNMFGDEIQGIHYAGHIGALHGQPPEFPAGARVHYEQLGRNYPVAAW